MCENQYFPCFDPYIKNHLSWENSSAVIMFLRMLPIRNLSYTCHQCVVNFEKKMHKRSQNWPGMQYTLNCFYMYFVYVNSCTFVMNCVCLFVCLFFQFDPWALMNNSACTDGFPPAKEDLINK